MARRGSCEEYRARGYHTGSIVRVAMRNFLTYSDTEAYPGPELNVVLGPNGTGKSALTHAICLACGGAPKSIGRSDDITQFVKKGSEHENLSYCEVDILCEHNVRTIRRQINSETKSSKWTMGGKATTQKEVKEFMATYNIDVDNLNSFMPQDKVGSFTQQTPEGILHNTLQCINMNDGSNRTLADEQIDLANHQSSNRQKEREVAAKQLTVTTLTQEMQAMEDGVRRMKQRSEMKELLKLYKIKAAVVELEVCEASVKQLQEGVDDAVKALNKAQEDINPLETEERELKQEVAVRDRQVQTATAQLGKSDAAIATLHETLDDCSVHIETTVNALGALNQTRRALEENLRVSELEVTRIQELKQQAEQELPQKQALLKQLDSDLSAAGDTISEVENETEAIRQQLQEKRDQADAIRSTMSSFTDNSQVFLRKIPNDFRDVHKVYDFIKRNSGRFVGEVLGPVGMHIKVDDAKVARILEGLIPPRRLMAFIASNQSDYDFINTELRSKQKLRFDLNLIENMENQRVPYSHDVLSELGEMCGGSVRYVGDNVPAPTHMPKIVNIFLQSFCSIHRALYLTPNERSNVDMSRLSGHNLQVLTRTEKQFTLFSLSRNGNDITNISGRKSRFNKDAPPILEFRDMVSSRFRLLSVENSDGGGARLDEMKRQMEQLKEEIRRLEHTHASASHSLQEAKQKHQDIRTSRACCQNDMKQVQVLNMELNKCTRRVAEITSQLARSAESERTSLKQKMKSYVDQYQGALRSLNGKMRAALDLVINHTVSSQSAKGIRLKHNAVFRNLILARDGLQEFQMAKRNAEMARDQQKQHMDELGEMIMELQQNCGGADKFNELYLRCIRECPEQTFADIEVRRQEINEIISKSIDNHQLLDKYKKTAQLLKEEEALLHQLKQNSQLTEKEIAPRLDDWIKKVKNLAFKLNALFSKFMAELNYKGTVELRQQGGLDTYSMVMQVSFRENVDIGPLCGQRHSGGERAVATIMYLMALQGLTTAPFRVVDEINQGMDERNERLVFDIIVRNSCVSEEEKLMSANARKPQYFLVSPKLLQGLRAMEGDGVTVLMVWNGPGALDISLSNVIGNLGKQKRGRNGEVEEATLQKDDEETCSEEDGYEHKDGDERSSHVRKKAAF